MTSLGISIPFSLDFGIRTRRTFKKIGSAILMMAGRKQDTPARHELLRTFDEVLKQYDGMISRVCFGYANTSAEFDDLHQDALINVWNALSGFKGESTLKTWVYRITLNTCVSTLRKRPKQPVESLDDSVYNIIDEDTDKKRLLQEMHECIAQLPPVDKAIVLLWLDEFRYEEIAEMTGLPRNTVATRLRRARQKLSE